MSKWLRRTASVLGVGSAAGALAVGVASRRWQASTERLTDELLRGATAPPGRVSFPALDSVPAPVRRYFGTVLRDGQPYVRSARLAQSGHFRSKESPDPEAGWQPFEATELFTAEPPGFVWDARLRMAPLASVWVRDGYVGGRAAMRVTMLGIVTVAKAADEPHLRSGALLRYLAESVWFPTALLPREGFVWSPMDDSHARATLTDRETSVSLEFEFGQAGEIVSCHAPGRQRSAPGELGGYQTLPWGGRYSRYEDRGGIRVPLESEVFWVVDGKEQPYYRGRIVRLECDLGREGP
jgi:hypothetical protein